METNSSSQKVVGSLGLKHSKICTNCHTTKTSLWRNGPLGPKSLCNACGIRYRRMGMKAPEEESKDNKGKKRRRSNMLGNRNQKRGTKALKLGSKGENSKKQKQQKVSKEVNLGVTTIIEGCRKELVLPNSQQHGDEVEKAAIQLMHLSGAHQYLIENK